MSRERQTLFMMQKTASEIEAALSYYYTGLEALKQHVSDVYEVEVQELNVISIGKEIKFQNNFTGDCVLICNESELPEILKLKSQENYEAIRAKPQ